MKHHARLWGAILLGAMTSQASADERIVNYWRPGQIGTLAATPGEPGWTVALVYMNMVVDASDSRDLTPLARAETDVRGRADMVFVVPTYTFERFLWGGRPSIRLGMGAGYTRTAVDASLSMSTGVTVSDTQRRGTLGVADMFPQASLKWNDGANNYMAYLSGVLPVGSYRQGRLANPGSNRWALDAGGGYTYFDLKKSMEMSLVAGLSYKGRNPAIDFLSGAEAHLDWTASYFILPHLHAGMAGYFYRQLRGDSGSGAILGNLKSRINGLGPQAGMYFQAGERSYYLNAKAYREWGARHRAEGWNFWLTLATPLTGK